MPAADRARVPVNSLVFGYGPMLPLVAAALGAWTMAPPWPAIATRLAIVWAAVILVFVAGVRRGYGFDRPAASTGAEIATMLVYFVPGVAALALGTVGRNAAALALLAAGFALVAVLDPIAARAGNAPLHFARLRGPQMGIAVVSLAALFVRWRG